MIRRPPVLAALLGLAWAAGAGAGEPVASTEVQRQIDAVVQSLVGSAAEPTSVRSAVVLVDSPAHGLRYAAAAGRARGDSPEAMSTDRPFYIASITKPMVAVRILQLVEAGRLALDDTLASTGLLPDDALDRLHTYQGRRYGREITLRQLLQHRAGLRDVLLDDRDSLGHQHESGTAPGSIGGRWTASLPSFMECRAQRGGCTREDLDGLAAVTRWRAWDAAAWATDPGNGAAGMINYFLAAMGEAGLFVPGSDFHYADTHYILLGMLIEKVTGRSLDLELRDAVFRPLGMRHTYLSYSTDAASHARDPRPADFWLGDLPVISSGLDVSFDWAGGGVVTTAGDLNRFLRGVQHATVFRRSATRDEMLACVPTPVREGRRGGYGLGISCRDSERGPMWGHAGAWGSVMYLFPALDVAVTGTVNSVFDSRAMDALLMDSLRALDPTASEP